ncbi:MAG: nitroreductase family protein [Clostridia bacterium]|nr:nitroreductase family protein [Clostridia bacterium]
MEFTLCVNDRHCYRGDFFDTPVPREHLKKIMEAGLAAPSGCNKQTTFLTAVDDPALLQRMKAALDPQFALTAPAFICVLTKHVSCYNGKCYSVQDYSAAIENMLLAITDLGYSSCWYEGYVTEPNGVNERLKAILNVPEELDLVCVLPVGKAKEEGPRPRKKPFEMRAWFNGFEAE